MAVNTSLPSSSIPWATYVKGTLAAYLANRTARGLIDDLTHVKNMPVFLFSGLNDTIV